MVTGASQQRMECCPCRPSLVTDGPTRRPTEYEGEHQEPEDWWEQDAKRMGELGISYVRIGEFAWSRYEPQRGQFEWDWLDRALDILGKAG